MKKLAFLSCVFALLIAGCGPKDTDDSSEESQYDIYVAGSNKDGYATYWKNGTAFINQNLKEPYKDIAVSGSDVYTLSSLGYHKNNGTATALAGSSSGKSIIVSDGIVYVAGWIKSSPYRATYWKNGTAINLSGGGSGESHANSITVSGGNVYVAGFENYPYTSGGITNHYSTARYWKNSTGVKLSGSAGRNADSNSIFVSGNDIYVAGWQDDGYKGMVAKYWKNGTQVNLTNGNKSAYAEVIAVSPNGDVHVAGRNFYDGYGVRIVYWKNGVDNMIGTAAMTVNIQGAYSIALADNDVYIVALDSGYKLFKNGIATTFTSESGAIPRAVVAIQRTTGK